MDCKAQITDEYGLKYKCLVPATKKITIVTFAPHLQKEVMKVRILCDEHAKRLKHRHNYRIKHLGKQTTLTQEDL